MSPTTVLTPTQIAYFLYNHYYAPDYNSALFRSRPGIRQQIRAERVLRRPVFGLGAWRSIAPSSYNSFQLIFRKRFSQGLQFDFNYSLAKSFDWSSGVERSNSFGGGFIVNSWNPGQRRAVSDFDIRHSINANYIYELPFGKGKPLGDDAGRMADAFIGGWQLTGINRLRSEEVGLVNSRASADGC